MRKIAFRVWDIQKKKFIPENTWTILNTTSEEAFGVMTKDWEDYIEGEWFYPQHQIMSQFTGFYDKDGEEIWEGDLLNAYKPNTYMKGDRILEVRWNEKEGKFGYWIEEINMWGTDRNDKLMYIGNNCSGAWCKIIGNIFEK